MYYIYYFIFIKILKWKIAGRLPDTQKYLIAVYPHTSNWDFVYGVAFRSLLRLHYAKYLGKHQLFKWPYGWLFKALGGIPVDRGAQLGVVEQVAQLFKSRNKFVLALAPEGTRKFQPKIRSGFYHMAFKGGVPLVMIGLDFGSKTLKIADAFMPTGNYEEDKNKIAAFFEGCKGKISGNESTIAW